MTGERSRCSRRVGWEYCHSIVDDCCGPAYSELHDDERADTVTAFTRRALDFFLEHGVVAERLMTDNAVAYVNSRTLREVLACRAIRRVRTRPYAPKNNGRVERYRQTLQRESPYADRPRSGGHRAHHTDERGAQRLLHLVTIDAQVVGQAATA